MTVTMKKRWFVIEHNGVKLYVVSLRALKTLLATRYCMTQSNVDKAMQLLREHGAFQVKFAS